MNLIKRIFCGIVLVVDGKVIQEKPFIRWDAKPFCIKLVSAMVMLPCLVKPCLAVRRDIMPEAGNGLTVPIKCINKDVSDGLSSRGAGKFGNLGSKSSYEFLRSIANGVSMTHVNGNDSGDDASKDCGFWPGNSHDDFWSAIGLIPSLWLMFWAANLNRPNKN